MRFAGLLLLTGCPYVWGPLPQVESDTDTDTDADSDTDTDADADADADADSDTDTDSDSDADADPGAPVVTIGSVDLIDGAIRVAFTAADSDGTIETVRFGIVGQGLATFDLSSGYWLPPVGTALIPYAVGCEPIDLDVIVEAVDDVGATSSDERAVVVPFAEVDDVLGPLGFGPPAILCGSVSGGAEVDASVLTGVVGAWQFDFVGGTDLLLSVAGPAPLVVDQAPGVYSAVLLGGQDYDIVVDKGPGSDAGDWSVVIRK